MNPHYGYNNSVDVNFSTGDVGSSRGLILMSESSALSLLNGDFQKKRENSYFEVSSSTLSKMAEYQS